jgi:hypothetical protein
LQHADFTDYALRITHHQEVTMTNSEPVFRYEMRSGEPISVDDVNGDQIVITPISHAFVVRWTGGGWILNLPLAVTVYQNNMVRYLPIRDVTRLAQILLIKLAVLFIGVGLIWGRADRKTKRLGDCEIP